MQSDTMVHVFCGAYFSTFHTMAYLAYTMMLACSTLQKKCVIHYFSGKSTNKYIDIHDIFQLTNRSPP